MIRADAWIWGVSQHSESGQQPEYACIIKEGFTDAQYSKALEANEHPDMRELCAPLFAEFAADQRHLTRRREQIIPDEVYNGTEVAEVCDPAQATDGVVQNKQLTERGSASVRFL